MKKFFLLLITAFAINLICSSHTGSYAFTRIIDLVFDGMSVEPDQLQETLETIKKNKLKNKNIKNPKKLKPDKLFVIKARQKDPRNIQLEIDTSQSLVRTDKDIQMPISNQGFLDAVTEAIMLWNNVDIADVRFLPLKFGSLGGNKVSPEDGKNLITFRTVEAPEGIPDTPVVSIVNYARTDNVVFMNKLIMVEAGTILDVDIIFDPNNDSCRALHTTTGDFKISGDSVPISEGGMPPPDSPLFKNVENCDFISGGDITDLAVISIAQVLGLDFSPIVSSAATAVGLTMTRYALTSDDEIGLANLYPNKINLTDRGVLTGRVLLNKRPVKGAHVVIENNDTGEPTASTITNLAGRFVIKAIPEGVYNVYAEPLDGAIRKNKFVRNFYGLNADLNFTTGVYPTPIIISANKKTDINIQVKELSASAFNINYIGLPLTEKDTNESGGAALLPIRIMPGETLTDLEFWGDNISTNFGTLSVSGPSITVSNIENATIPISPFVKCSQCDDTPDTMCNRDPRCPDTDELTEEPDQIQGIKADITCANGTAPGPRNIIFTGQQIDITHPSFGLRDQITGGLTVTE